MPFIDASCTRSFRGVGRAFSVVLPAALRMRTRLKAHFLNFVMPLPKIPPAII